MPTLSLRSCLFGFASILLIAAAAPFAYAQGVWQPVQQVSSSWGIQPWMELDQTGNPCVAHRGCTGACTLRYTFFDGSAWQNEVGGSIVGHVPTLGLFSGEVRVISMNMDTTPKVVRYSVRTAGGVWQAPIAVTPNNDYLNPSGCLNQQSGLFRAVCFRVQPATHHPKKSASVAALVYFRQTSPTTWSVPVVIDDNGGVGFGSPTNWFPTALAQDSTGKIHVVYRDRSSAQGASVKYATFNEDGSNTQVSILAPAPQTTNPGHPIPRGVAIAVDSLDRLHVAYTRSVLNTAGNYLDTELLYAFKDGSTPWAVQLLTGINPYDNVSAAVDAFDQPYIGFMETMTGGYGSIAFARLNGATWEIHVAPSPTATSSFDDPALRVDATGKVHVAALGPGIGLWYTTWTNN